MEPMSIVFLCISNTGNEFINTRHNSSVIFAEIMSQTNIGGKEFCINSKILGTDCFFIGNIGYVNNVGLDFLRFCNKKKINLKKSKLIIVQDDLETCLGKWKISQGKGAGGHNGIRSINSCFNSDYQYLRIKIGIGRPTNSSVNEFVLEKFKKEEIILLRESCQEIKEKIEKTNGEIIML